MIPTDGKGLIVAFCIALAVITSAVYMQVGEHQFLNFDDNTYVTENSHVAGGLTGRNVLWAFTSVEVANWHPITWLSHMTDVQLFGMDPRGHHLTNVAIHIISTLSLFLLLVRLTGGLWQSAFVAAMFALHPLHVESVAWVAERKDVLSAFFWFLTLLLYADYVAKQKNSLYLLALLSFVLGLLSKPMLVTLPLVMLLLDFWPLGRFQCEAGQEPPPFSRTAMILIKEKLLFFGCSLLSGLITIYAQNKGGAVKGFSEVAFQLRIENALVAYVKYLGKTLWPHDLAVLYPFPMFIPLWQVIGSLMILLILCAAAIRTRYRHPYIAVGWFWFLITLVPVIGVIQVGGQSMADRYMYIPVIGLFVMATWWFSDITIGLRYREGILVLLAGGVIAAAAALTWKQLSYWRDNIAIYRRTLAVTAANSIIHDNLGAALIKKGDLDSAIQEYSNALRITPGNKNMHYNLGTAFQAKGDLDAAIREYRMSLRIFFDDADVHSNLGLALAGKGDLDAAILEYREALRISPAHAKAHSNLGAALANKGNLAGAILEFREALRINPNNTSARNNLERALAQKRIQDGIIK